MISALLFALIIAAIVIAVVFVIAHLIVTYVLIGRATQLSWLVYLIAALISILILWRAVAPALGALP